MSETALWGVIGIISGAVVTPIVTVALNVWWNRLRVIRILRRHFQGTRDTIAGMRGAILDSQSKAFQTIGPRGLRDHFRDLETRFHEYEALGTSLVDLLSERLLKNVQHAERAAHNLNSKVLDLASGQLEGHGSWGNNPAQLGVWSLHAEFMGNTLVILDAVIVDLTASIWRLPGR